MSRIAYRALVLVACAVMCAGLIAARPLPATPARSGSMGGAALLAPAQPAPMALGVARAITSRGRLDRPAARTIDGVAPTEQLLAAALTPLAELWPAPARIPGTGPAMAGALVAQTERLDFYIGKQTFGAAQVSALAPLIERALRADEARFGTTLQHRVSLGFYRAAFAPKRGVRGMAYTDQERVELYYRSYEDPNRAAIIVAHELGHHLEAQRYGEGAQRRADTILLEGLATWIAADRWLPMCSAASWKTRARELRNAGVPLRLLTAERSGPDNAYELWASFVDFIVDRYGWERFDALYRSGRGRAPGSSDYQAILGKSIDDLADEWRAWLDE